MVEDDVMASSERQVLVNIAFDDFPASYFGNEANAYAKEKLLSADADKLLVRRLCELTESISNRYPHLSHASPEYSVDSKSVIRIGSVRKGHRDKIDSDNSIVLEIHDDDSGSRIAVVREADSDRKSIVLALADERSWTSVFSFKIDIGSDNFTLQQYLASVDALANERSQKFDPPLKAFFPFSREVTTQNLDAAAISTALIELGYPTTENVKSLRYAYEHRLGDQRYIYVKRASNGVRKKRPLVLHPNSEEKRLQVDSIKGIQVDWERKTQSSAYRHYPKLDGRSQYGYAANVSSKAALMRLMRIIVGPPSLVAPTSTPGDQMTNRFDDLNQILYGPPGTGKTYKTTEEAVRLADPARYKAIMDSSADDAEKRRRLKATYDELVNAGRIRFVTFHQSFSYEDFVEGVKATTDENGELVYRVEDGLFKELSTIADAQVTRAERLDKTFEIADRRIWKMSLGNTLADEDNAYEECIDGGYIGLGWGGDIDFSGCDSRQAVEQRFAEVKGAKPEGGSYDVTAVNTFKNVIRERDIVVVSNGNHKFRAIGEVMGRYEFSNDQSRHFRQNRSVRWLRVFDPSLPREALFRKALSQMTLYELKPSTIKVETLAGFLSEPTAASADNRNHVLIIDEINRGNISRIFGELITLLEPDKRKGGADAREVTLPYSGKPFRVPSNLYVIGTMNTADKSLAQLDLALRRRFSFTEVLPEPDLLRGIVIHRVDIGEMLQTINDRIELLLDRDHLIGHSYFLSLREWGGNSEAQLARIFESKIIPLLQEYFFSDWERIRWVLNDVGKAPAHQFVQMLKDVTGRPAPFGANPPKDLPEDRRYRINRDAFFSPEAYQGITN